MPPHEVRFDEFYGVDSVESFLAAPLARRKLIAQELVNDRARVAAYYDKGGIYDLIEGKKGDGRNFRRVKPLKTEEAVDNLDQDCAAYSVGFIRRAAKEEKPFFLEHSIVKVHYDNIPGKGYQGRSPAKTAFQDAVVEVDDIVGRLMAALKETRQLENTLVFFTSDHGPEEDAHPEMGFTPFRGGKGTTWECGVRVPGDRVLAGGYFGRSGEQRAVRPDGPPPDRPGGRRVPRQATRRQVPGRDRPGRLPPGRQR